MRLDKIDNTYIVNDLKAVDILCVITKTEYFFSCVSSHLIPNGKGFKSKGEAFLYAVEGLNSYYKRKAENEVKGIKAENKKNEGKLIPSERVASINKTVKWETIKKVSSKIALISVCVLLFVFSFFSRFSDTFGELISVVYLINSFCVVVSLIVLMISFFALYMRK